MEEAEGTAFSFYERMCHHTLKSTDDRAYELVCRLIDEYSPLFRSNLFNINCDETFDLGRGRGKESSERVLEAERNRGKSRQAGIRSVLLPAGFLSFHPSFTEERNQRGDGTWITQ